jgi:hypothetical protein
MTKPITKEKIEEIKKIAEEKLDAVQGRINDADYQFYLREVIKEIASDMGYIISDSDIQTI